MEQSSSYEKIQHQYDTLAKKTLKGEARSYLRAIARRAAREVVFSDLGANDLNQLFLLDEYNAEYSIFQVSGFDIIVKDELLGAALTALSERKRNIVLLSYYLDMSDEEIAALLNVVRSTIFRHRKNALEEIRKYMEGNADGKKF